MTVGGLEVVVLLKLPSAGISSIVGVTKAVKAGAAHMKAKKEYEDAVEPLMGLLEQLKLLAQAQIEASSIITEFAFFSSGLSVGDLSRTSIESKFDRFNDRLVAQRGLAEAWTRAIHDTRLHCGDVIKLAGELDKKAQKRNLQNLFGFLGGRVERLVDLRRQLNEVAENDPVVIDQYDAMADAVSKALNEIKTTLYGTGEHGGGDAAARLKAADAVLAAHADKFRPINEQGTEVLNDIRAALTTLRKPTA